MAKLIDLDELLGEPIDVKLEGTWHRLPGDLPSELFLKVTSLGDQELTQAQLIEQLHDELLKLFRVHNPDLERLPLGIKGCMDLIPLVYGGGAEPKAEEKPRPTQPKTRGASARKSPSARKPAARKTSRS